MSRNELVQAYLEGRIGRRGFIRGMAATGASLTMAAAAADRLRVSAQVDVDPYGPYETPTATPTQVPEEPGGETPVPTEVPEEPGGETPAPTKVPKGPTQTPVAGKTGDGSGATTLPSTGAGDVDNKGGILTPISLAASAAAAAIAFRVRRLRKPETETE